MSLPDDKTRVQHIVDAAKRAVTIGEETDWDRLRADDVEALALARLLEIVGEAARAVSPELRDRYPDVPWRDMIDTRNRIIHAYFRVDLDVVQRIVQSELPLLLVQLTDVQDGQAADDT